jgi:hypothetical protein
VGLGRGVKNREAFPAAAKDGFTAARLKTMRDHRYSGKFIFLRNTL